jgi:hypothetical protein
MPNEGFILIKGEKKPYSYRNFYGPLDKSAARPSFCYPKRKEDLKEDIDKTKRAMESGYISPERKMEVEAILQKKEKRLDDINAQEADAKKIFEENKDALMKRRAELARDIKDAMPSRDAVKKKIVNPHTTLKMEKGGLEDKKKEFIVLSRLAGEESNITFLQKDKG